MKTVVNYEDQRWRGYKIDFSRIAKQAAGRAGRNATVSIILTNDASIQKLNKKYRGFDKPTNVLSFETGDDVLLGDIFISIDTVMRESKEENKNFKDHVAHMVVHGMLHLLGGDHIVDLDAKKMESSEIEILDKLRIANPYSDEKIPGSNKLFNRSNLYKNPVLTYIIYFLLGGFSCLGFAPFNLWWATIIGIGCAYLLTISQLSNSNKTGLWKSLLGAWPFGCGYAIGMFWWVVNSIYVVPDLAAQFAIWTAPSIIGIGLFGGLIFAIPFTIIRAVRMKSAYRPFLFAVIWAFVLWLREWAFTGFPWNPVANITMQFPMLSNSMSVWGALGLTFIIVGLIAGVGEIIKDKKHKNGLFAICVFSGLLIMGFWLGHCNIKKSVIDLDKASPIIRIIQPASTQDEKSTHSRDQAILNAEKNIHKLIQIATENNDHVDIMIFPETAYPYLITSDDVPMARVVNKKIILGATSYDNGKYYNSLVVADKSGKIETLYNKSHLVPFGEYRPLGGLIPGPGDLTAGSGPETINIKTDSAEINFAPAICYEIVFSNSLIPKRSEKQPTMVINITNDTWFGKTPGTYQHLDMVRRYAIESGLPIVRSNYSGISAFIASDGTILSSLGVGISASLDGRLSGDHMTVYRALGRDLWMVIILLFAAVASISIYVFQKKD